jgi:hypothetical protein
MKKTYRPPLLTRREILTRIAASTSNKPPVQM